MSVAYRNMIRQVSSVLATVTGCLLISGCLGGNSAESSLASLNDQNIKRLANLYFTFQKQNNWEGPEDEEQFKEFIRTYSPRKLERIGIDPAKTDDLFVNERDGEPFKIRYGVLGSMMGSNEPVVFESTGVRGKKMVGFLNMTQREVEQSEYDDLWEGNIAAVEAERDQDQ